MANLSPKEYLKNLHDLPPLPGIAMQALAVAEDPSSTASDLLRIIMSDPPLAAKVLRVANSVHFHRGYPVTDLQTAIADTNTTEKQLKDHVMVVRAARARTQAEKAAAQKELRLLLTSQQEAVLVTLGYME